MISSVNHVGDPDTNPTDNNRMWQMLTEDRKEQWILLFQIGNGRFWRHRYHQWQSIVILNAVSSILRTACFSYYDINLHLNIPLSSPSVLERAKSLIPLRNALVTHLADIFGTA